MDERLSVGVAGVGHLGALHAKMLSTSSSALLAGVFDTDQEKAARIAAQYGTRPFPSLEALLDRVQALTVAVPTTAHHVTARAALERGVPVFIEKPVTQTLDEADDLCRLGREHNAIIQVGHIERFNPAILALERYTINPMFVESHRLAQFNPRGTDVAVVLDLMIHDIDLILSFVKAPVTRIDANGVAVVSDSVDIANARVQFGNGCVANVTASRISQRKMRKMRLFQQREYISIDFLEGSSEVFRMIEGEAPETRGTMMLGEIGAGKHRRTIVYEQPEVKEVNALQYEIELFVKTVREGGSPVVSGEDGRRALEVAGLILESINQQTVQLS
jgi:predicted dehydrogenase